MIKLTKNAADKVKQIIEERDRKPIGIQAGVKGGGCSGFSYYLDFVYEEKEDFKKLESHDVKILVDTKSYLYLLGTEIDYIDGLSGKGFKFINPNAKRTCGCGESFSV